MKKLISLIRSIKNYFIEYKNIHKSFMLSKKNIKIKKKYKVVSNVNINLKFNDNLFQRLRINFLNEIYKTSGHWKEIYKSMNLDKLLDDLNKKDNKFFYETISQPHNNEIHHGFSEITKSITSTYKYFDFYYYETIYDCVFRTACSLGLVRLPEVYHKNNNQTQSIEEILDKIFNKINAKSDFRNTFSMEKGISTTKYGIVSYVSAQQLYHAIKVLKFTENIKNPKILEIGAGLGSSAYHLWNFGIKNYSIMDLPLSAISIGYNLSSLIGDKNILFNKEINTEDVVDKIKIFTPDNLNLIEAEFDLIINCDSITEMSKDVARKYIDFASRRAKFFLSINHEGNSFSVNELFKDSSFEKVSRNLTWYRQGYTEELFKNNNL